MGMFSGSTGLGTFGTFMGAPAIFNAAQAQKSRDFQQSMRGSAWQATVQDMQAAGLNPMLAYSRGPNMTPSASQAEGGGGDAMAAISNSAAKVADLDKIKAETRNVNAEAERNEAIASILNKVGPRIVEGVGAVETGAKSLGEGVSEITRIIREAIERWGKDASPRDVINNIPDRIRELLPNLPDIVEAAKKMPPAQLYRDVKDAIDKRGTTPSRSNREGFGSTHSAWGIGEYERAQQERHRQAAQSPASRRRQQ